MHHVINLCLLLIFSLVSQIGFSQTVKEQILKEDSLIIEILETEPEKGLQIAKENYQKIVEADLDNYTEARVTSTLAMAYHINNNYLKAIDYRLSAIISFEEINAYKELIESYNLLGGIFYNIGEYDKTVKCTLNALSIAEQINHVDKIPTLYNNLAGAYRKLNDFDSAFYYAKKLLSVAEKHGDNRDEFFGISILGEIYLDKNECDSALYYFNKLSATNYPQEAVSGYMASFIALDIARAHWCMKDTIKALNKAKRAYRLTEAHQQVVLKKEVAGLLYNLLEAVGQPDSSFYYRQQMMALQDSIWSREKDRQLNNIIISHRENELLSQKEATKKQKQLTRYSIIIGLIFLVLFIIFIIANRKIRKLNKKLKQQKAELQKLHRFKDKVFSTVVHDFKTPINSLENMLTLIIGGHLRTEESETLAAKMLEQVRLSKSTINNLIVWVKKQMDGFDISEKPVEINKILDETRGFHLQLSETKNITITVDVPEDFVLNTDYEVLLVILNNLLSNAIKFTRNGGHIQLEARRYDHGTQITIEDNGIGFDKEILADIFNPTKPTKHGTALEKGTGLGLIICKELIDKLGGTMQVESKKDKGSKITLSFTH